MPVTATYDGNPPAAPSTAGELPLPVCPPMTTAASPRWPGPAPRPEPGHWVPVISAGRPPLTFPTGGHQCRQYRIVSGFYECDHGHVLRINNSRLGGGR